MRAHDVVTGAFGYTGRYIAERLLAQGRQVTTLTGRPDRQSPFGDQVRALPFNFDDPGALAKALEGVDTLYNTYWIRFPRHGASHDFAVRNSRTLLKAAQDAGVRRVVHISITGAASAPSLPYFRGKAQVEEEVLACRLSYAIIRPTVVFGHEDILINNIAWLLRRFPVFVVPGSGEYRVQPVYVGDLASMAVAMGQRADNVVTDAVGPETYTFNELLGLLAASLGARPRIVHARPAVALLLSRAIGLFMRDVVITRDEVAGLCAGLLVSQVPPACTTTFRWWLTKNAHSLGSAYASELARHYRHRVPSPAGRG
jgi:NADH dehydrogenase